MKTGFRSILLAALTLGIFSAHRAVQAAPDVPIVLNAAYDSLDLQAKNQEDLKLLQNFLRSFNQASQFDDAEISKAFKTLRRIYGHAITGLPSRSGSVTPDPVSPISSLMGTEMDRYDRAEFAQAAQTLRKAGLWPGQSNTEFVMAIETYRLMSQIQKPGLRVRARSQKEMIGDLIGVSSNVRLFLSTYLGVTALGQASDQDPKAFIGIQLNNLALELIKETALPVSSITEAMVPKAFNSKFAHLLAEARNFQVPVAKISLLEFAKYLEIFHLGRMGVNVSEMVEKLRTGDHREIIIANKIGVANQCRFASWR